MHYDNTICGYFTTSCVGGINRYRRLFCSTQPMIVLF